MTVRWPRSKLLALVVCYVLALQTSLAAIEMVQAAELGGAGGAPILCTPNAGPASDGPADPSHRPGHACLLCPMPMCGGGLAPVSAALLGIVRPAGRVSAVPEPPSGAIGRSLRAEPYAPRAPPALA